MSMQKAFDEALASLSNIIARDLAEARAAITKLSEEHAAKVAELRNLREQYRRQMLAAVRAEVSGARQVDRETIQELRDEIADLRRELAKRQSEYAR